MWTRALKVKKETDRRSEPNLLEFEQGGCTHLAIEPNGAKKARRSVSVRKVSTS